MRLTLLLLGCMLTAINTDAQVFEHLGDRTIIHVDEMPLHGDESLFDILLSVPEQITTFGRTLTSNMNESWSLRVDNINIDIDAESFLKNTKACDIKTVKVCAHPGTLKGSGGTTKVIDVYYRTKENGTYGSHNIEGGTHGNATTYHTLEYQHDNLNIKSWLVGDMDNEKNYGADYQTHALREDAKVLISWDATKTDHLLLNVNQTALKSHNGDDPSSKEQVYMLYSEYIHDFSNGAYGLLTAGGEFENLINADGSHLRPNVIFTCMESSFPLFSHNLWITPGVETGYAHTKYVVTGDVEQQHYVDLYAQADWTLKKFHFSLGARYHMINYWIHNEAFTTSWSNLFFNTSAWYVFNPKHTIQATFDKRFFTPEYSAFTLTDDAGTTTGYTTDVYHPTCYVSELRYTFQKKNITLAALVQDTWQEFDRGTRIKRGDDNVISAGLTANWKVSDCFRLLIGATWNWEHYNNIAEQYVKNNQYANIRLSPELRIKGWRMLATVVYNTLDTPEGEIYPSYRSNCYGALRVSKDLSKKWNIYADLHDLIDERAGNREAILGVTYRW